MKEKSGYDRRVMRLFDGYVHGEMSRREFLERLTMATASTTAAAAILATLSPDYALAQQVDPDDKSIRTSYKRYGSPKGAGVMNGYFARPAATGHKLPAVLVIHENRGLNPYIEDVARRCAVAGFMAFAPDALTPLGGYPGNDDEGRALQRQRDRDEMAEDFVAAVEFLARHPDSTGKVGAVGFCFGGAMALQLAVRIPDLGAAVAFYGRHPDPRVAASINAPLMLHHAELDDRVNASWPKFEEALKAADREYINHDYADASHGFHNDTTPRYDEEAARLAWERTLEFFTAKLE
ncbi:MAG: dienelactone hydrolase family protein [Woeseiaceae bacterium]|nr:dienelactone hydrolase family protein [Woeseiaceae bacterium]